MCKVTVILTSYNHAKYIRETIDSILNQTFKDFELIIWDDASTDESWEIIQSYDDPRIKKFQSERTERGLINKALLSGEVRGTYIAIHHSDDIWEPTKLEKQVAFLESHLDVGAVFTNAMAMNEESQPFLEESHFYFSIFDQPNRTRHEWLNFFFYHGNALCHPSVLIRKKCYDECGLYRYGLAQLGDYDMWIRLCMKYEIYVLPEKLTKFRVRDNEANSSGNTSTTRIRTMNEHYFIIEKFLQLQGIDDVVKIFPKASEYIIDGKYVIEYILAMMALEECAWRDIKLHGLNLLYKLMNDTNKAQQIKELYCFDYLNLISLSTKYDVFNIENNASQHFIQLFIDEGNGYSEKNSIKFLVVQNTKLQEFIFELSDKQSIKALRLDPFDECCVIEIESLHLKKEDDVINLLPYIQTNAEINHSKAYFFTTEDSQIYFNGLEPSIFENAQALLVVLRYVYISKDALYVSVKQKNQELSTKETSIQALNQELLDVYTSKSWKITRPLRHFKRIIKGQ